MSTPKVVFLSVGVVVESSKPGKFYDIKLGRDGVRYCTCPAWKFQKVGASHRDCKHLRAFREALAARKAA